MARKIAEEDGSQPRPRVAAPHIPLSALRRKMNLTLETVCDRIGEQTGVRPEKGTLSAIELGHRGASREMLDALAQVYDIDPKLIDTNYAPRHQQGATR